MKNLEKALVLIEAVAEIEEGGVQKLLRQAIQLIQTDGAFCQMNDYERSLLDNGRKIDAIKNVRSRLGLGLKEAKDVVEGNYRGPTA